ncbi:MAG: hypothetical protein ACRYGI_09235 [Janthinobacterium lividum]
MALVSLDLKPALEAVHETSVKDCKARHASRNPGQGTASTVVLPQLYLLCDGEPIQPVRMFTACAGSWSMPA